MSRRCSYVVDESRCSVEYNGTCIWLSTYLTATIRANRQGPFEIVLLFHEASLSCRRELLKQVYYQYITSFNKTVSYNPSMLLLFKKGTIVAGDISWGSNLGALRLAVENPVLWRVERTKEGNISSTEKLVSICR